MVEVFKDRGFREAPVSCRAVGREDLTELLSGARGTRQTRACPLLGEMSQAAQNMIHVVAQDDPDPALLALYREKYQCFIEECTKWGYIKST